MHLLLVSVQAHTSENETSWNKILHASFSLSFHRYFLVERRMTRETPKASAFNDYIWKWVPFLILHLKVSTFSHFQLNTSTLPNSGADPGSFHSGDPNFCSERAVELFCGKSLLKETARCFSICERRSPLTREILLCEHGEHIIGGYPKTITF